MTRAKQLDLSLAYADKRLQYYRSISPAIAPNHQPSQPATGGLSSLELSGLKALAVAGVGAGMAGEGESSEQEANGSMDYEKMLEKCSALKETLKK